MKFSVCMDGDVQTDVEADDATVAAVKSAAADFNASAGETPRGGVYDVTVMDPDGVVTRHAVTLEWDPIFSACRHREAPRAKDIEALRADRGATEGGAS